MSFQHPSQRTLSSRILREPDAVAACYLRGAVTDSILSPKPGSEPICPICFHEIQPSDRASTQGGELLHFLCYTGVPPLPSFLGRNLAQQRERPFCLPCLGEEFGLTEREVRDAVRELSSTRRFRVDIDTRWRCREVRTTVSAFQPQQ